MHPGTIGGAKLVLMRKWDAGRALELIEREGVTNFSGVPTMSRELLMHPDWATREHVDACRAWAAAVQRCSPTWSRRSPAR